MLTFTLLERDRVQAVAVRTQHLHRFMLAHEPQAYTFNASTMWVVTASDTIKIWCGTTQVSF